MNETETFAAWDAWDREITERARERIGGRTWSADQLALFDEVGRHIRFALAENGVLRASEVSEPAL